MDFDSVITLLFIIGFFILPSILKQVKARKKKTASTGTPKKKLSILDKIGAQVGQFVQELEKQGQQQRTAVKDPANIWDMLAQDETVSPNLDRTSQDEDFDKPLPIVSPKKIVPRAVVTEKAEQRTGRSQPGRKEGFIQKPLMGPAIGTHCFKPRRPLQNAIIWSEILGKPVALRGGQKIF